MFTLKIDTAPAVRLTNELEKLHRSALPNAVRGTLNKTAFDVKQNTMPKSADKAFVQRKKTFFKATSRVNMAKGWKIESMESTVGFQGKNNQAVEDLEQQEFGGKIGGRAFIPTNKARGGNPARNVRPSNRMGGISNPINSAKIRTRKNRGRVVSVKSPEEKFTVAAIKAGKGGYILGNRQPKMLLRVTGLKKVKGKTKVKTTELYSYKKSRVVTIKKPTRFMNTASHQSARKMNRFYEQEARRQIDKRKRRL